jgi:RNA methyltransferase, TrmH family
MLSKDNKHIKNALKLKQKKYREEEGKFIAEGIRFVEEAINEGLCSYVLYSDKVYTSKGYERVLGLDIEKYEVSNDIIKELCDTENPQGIAAVVNKPKWNIDEIKEDFIVVTDGIQDPGNLGTIIRTSDAAGAGAISIIKGTVDVYNSKTLRSTMGSIFHVPILFYDNFEELAEDLKVRGYSIYSTSLGTDKYIYNCNFKDKTAIVIGNEANGVPEEHLNLSTHLVKIPMPGKSESLNAASAAAIIIYEVVRQRINL